MCVAVCWRWYSADFTACYSQDKYEWRHWFTWWMFYIPFLFLNYQALCVFSENLKTGMETYSIALVFQITFASAVSLNKIFKIILLSFSPFYLPETSNTLFSCGWFPRRNSRLTKVLIDKYLHTTNMFLIVCRMTKVFPPHNFSLCFDIG